MIAAEEIYATLVRQTQMSSSRPYPGSLVDCPPNEAVNYEAKLKASWVGRELHTVRNINGSFSRGLVPGLLHTWLSTVLTRGYEPWTLRKSVPDHQMTKRAVDCEPIEYPKPDG
eukprot:gene17217-21763_t